MPGTSPLLGIQYPTATDTPAGMEQMETILRALEQYGVLVAANATERDAVITAGLRHEGSVVFLTDSETLQVRAEGAWQKMWKPGDLATRRVESLGDPSGTPGEIVVRQSAGADDTVHFSTGGAWLRLLDTSDASTAKNAVSFDFVHTTSQGGVTQPDGGGNIKVPVKVPDSGSIQITVSAKLRTDGNNGIGAIFGYEVRNSSGGTIDTFTAGRAALCDRNSYNASSWSSIRNLGPGQAGKTVDVFGVHATENNAQRAEFTVREIVVVPVR